MELLVPYGLDTSNLRLVPPEQASRERTYVCPQCQDPLRIRAGEPHHQMRRHFAHTTDDACHYETLLHLIAKLLLVQAIDDNANGAGRPISLECECAECRLTFALSIPEKHFNYGESEVRLGAFVCDVVAYRAGSAALALEVLTPTLCPMKSGSGSVRPGLSSAP